MISNVLGEGAYGQVVVKNGVAVKSFKKLQHIVQEYAVLRYLRDCKYVVKTTHVDFSKLELSMELYDSSLRIFLLKNKLTKEQQMTCIKHLLYGLIEFHDRDLAHGDIKPGNLLVRRHPFQLVLGDCGFTSVAKYAKVERTAEPYRDPEIAFHISHDMYSFGICLYELSTGMRFRNQKDTVKTIHYDQMVPLIEKNVKDKKHKFILLNVLHPNKNGRMSARDILEYLYHENPEKWDKKSNIYVSKELDKEKIVRDLFKYTCYHFHINRSNKGYYFLLHYFYKHNIGKENYVLYTCSMLILLASLFSTFEIKERDIIALSEEKYNDQEIYNVIYKLLQDDIFVDLLLSP
jgi:serine/threonine protein kinase